MIDIYESERECAQPGCYNTFVPEKSTYNKCGDHRGSGSKIRKTTVINCPGCGKRHFQRYQREFLVTGLCEDCSQPPYARYGIGRLRLFRSYNELARFIRGPMSHYFVGVDGEGIGKGRNHKYVLLGLGDNEPLIDRKGIKLGDAFRYLWQQYDDKAIYVSFYFIYDLSQILCQLSWERAEYLFTHGGVLKRQRKYKNGAKKGQPIPHAIPRPMEFHDHTGQRWQLDVLEGKTRRIKFRPRDCDCTFQDKGKWIPDTECRHMKKVPWFVICDVAEFFGDAFLNIVESDGLVATPDEMRILEAGKKIRGDAPLDQDMILYNRTECIVLARIMTRVREALGGIGITLDKDEWYGIGQAAQKWMIGQDHILTREQFQELGTYTSEIFKIAQASYYGGLVENIAHGIVPGETWYYDRRSAYCADMRELPCLYHADFEVHEGSPGPLKPGQLRMEHVKVIGRLDAHTGPLQYRENGIKLIKRPVNTSGWHWSDEIDAAYEAGLIQSRETDKWLEITPRCDCPNPLAGVMQFFGWRKLCRKGSIEEGIFKRLPSAVYGKLAQSAGASKFGNALYASLITSRCRTAVLTALNGRMDDTVMIVQDAIYTRHRHPELIGSELGQWKEEGPLMNLTIVQPQFHYHDKHRAEIQEGINPAMKARGIRTQDDRAQIIMQCDEGFGAWWENGQPVATWKNVKWPEIILETDFDVTTPQQAVTQKNWSRCGLVRDEVTYTIRTNPDAHRTTELGAFKYDEKLQAFVSSPWYTGMGGNMETTAYSKDFGYIPDDMDIENLGNTPNGPRGVWIREGTR